jgi:putative RNA 2'-phosphotransferase
MNEKQKTRTSKFLSLVLRHEPERIGLELDSSGWVEVDVFAIHDRSTGQPVLRSFQAAFA